MGIFKTVLSRKVVLPLAVSSYVYRNKMENKERKKRAKEILEYCLETVKSSALSKDPNATTQEGATNLEEDAKRSRK